MGLSTAVAGAEPEVLESTVTPLPPGCRPGDEGRASTAVDTAPRRTLGHWLCTLHSRMLTILALMFFFNFCSPKLMLL